jgi:hypothetical protein
MSNLPEIGREIDLTGENINIKEMSGELKPSGMVFIA